MTSFNVGDVVQYEEGRYTFKGIVLSKHPETGVWYPAMEYVCNESGQRYVREKLDFEKKFVVVPQEKKTSYEVEANPLFSSMGHQAWGADCPHCGQYWESLCTEKESPITCDSCEEEFAVTYPGASV